MTNEELVEKIREGQTQLVEELWNQTEGLIRWAASRFYAQITAANGGTAPGGLEWIGADNRKENTEDLVQSGYFALVKAIEQYNPEAGAAFSTFLLLHLRNEFQACSGGRSKRRRNDPLNHAASLDAPFGEDDDGETLLNMVPDTRDFFRAAEERIFRAELRAALEAALDRLPDREAKVLREFYFCDKTQGQIGEELGCSSQAVAQFQKRGINRIRHSSDRRTLEAFIDDRTNFYRGIFKPHSTENKAIWREHLRDLATQDRLDGFNQIDENTND